MSKPPTTNHWMYCTVCEDPWDVTDLTEVNGAFLCAECHQEWITGGWPESSVDLLTGADSEDIPLEERVECSLCHTMLDADKCKEHRLIDCVNALQDQLDEKDDDAEIGRLVREIAERYKEVRIDGPWDDGWSVGWDYEPFAYSAKGDSLVDALRQARATL